MTRREAHELYGSVSLLILVVLIIAFVAAKFTANYAEGLPPDSCSCANKPEGCYTQVFEMDRGKRAYCAFWGERQNCCLIRRVPG